MKSKKFFIGLTAISALVLFCGCDKKVEEKKEALNPEVFEGIWGAGRTTLNVTKESMNTYKFNVNGATSASESIAWEYTCNFNEQEEVMDCTGSRKDISFDSKGKETAETKYTDGKAKFKYNDNKITWEDEKDNAGLDVEFVK